MNKRVDLKDLDAVAGGALQEALDYVKNSKWSNSLKGMAQEFAKTVDEWHSTDDDAKKQALGKRVNDLGSNFVKAYSKGNPNAMIEATQHLSEIQQAIMF